MEICELCQAKDGLYEFHRLCCKVRYLLAEPRLEIRIAWLDRWRKKYGIVEAEELEREVTSRWVKKRKAGDEKQLAMKVDLV